MNPIAIVYQNPLIPEGDYWVRLCAIANIPYQSGDVSDSWVASLVIEQINPAHQGMQLHVAVHGTKNATPFRLRFREHFRCMDYPPKLAIGRWAKVQIVPAEFNGREYSQVWFPELRVGALTRVVYEAAELERKFGTVPPPKASLRLLGLHRETVLLNGGGVAAD